MVIVGLITSSRRYSNLNDGKAIAIKIKAGVIVQTVSIKVIHLLNLQFKFCIFKMN
jgi:hypothetical protein